MYLKLYDLVFEAYLNNKNDMWINNSYRNYLINEEHVMDMYTKYGNYWMRESYGDGDYQAYYFGFGGDGIGTWGVTRRIGRSVRLVREL